MTADGVKLSLEGAKGGSAETFDAEVVLVAIGRRPFTKNIGLEEVVRIPYTHIKQRKTNQAACMGERPNTWGSERKQLWLLFLTSQSVSQSPVSCTPLILVCSWCPRGVV